MSMRVRCRCGFSVVVDERQTGEQVCPKCKKVLQVRGQPTRRERIAKLKEREQAG